jgi:hypothetical protein
MDLISDRRAIADPRAGHIERQICKFEEHWLARSGESPNVEGLG